MWETKDYQGNPVKWYSEEDIKIYKDKFRQLKNMCNETFTSSEDVRILKESILNIIKSEEGESCQT